jgi:hypothetical protein
LVANPAQWKWETLFLNKREEYNYGRIQRHYPLVQRGDLVIGYQANPDKRIVALAKVSREFGPGENDQPCIEIVPLAGSRLYKSLWKWQKKKVTNYLCLLRFLLLLGCFSGVGFRYSSMIFFRTVGASS